MIFKALKLALRGKVAKANKRLQRLEGNKLTNTPAYKYSKEMLGDRKRFTSAGDNYNELQKEMARVDKFLNSKTSLVRGANAHLKSVASRVGIKYNNIGELPQKTSRFFELTSKVEQYLKNVEGSYHALGYQKVWESVSNYVNDNNIDLGAEDFDVDDYLSDLIEETRYDNAYQPNDWDNMDWFDV